MMVSPVALIIAIIVGNVIMAAKSQTFTQGAGRCLILTGMIVVAWFGVQWAITEWYITTHCTMVLGTRVCQ